MNSGEDKNLFFQTLKKQEYKNYKFKYSYLFIIASDHQEPKLEKFIVRILHCNPPVIYFLGGQVNIKNYEVNDDFHHDPLNSI